MERFEVIVISRIKKINKIDINLEEVEVYYNSSNLDFYRFTSSNELVSIKDIDITFAVVL